MANNWGIISIYLLLDFKTATELFLNWTATELFIVSYLLCCNISFYITWFTEILQLFNNPTLLHFTCSTVKAFYSSSIQFNNFTSLHVICNTILNYLICSVVNFVLFCFKNFTSYTYLEVKCCFITSILTLCAIQLHQFCC